ncbi:MAG: ATP-binding protein, partial [Rhodanobacteraceae bacterium]
ELASAKLLLESNGVRFEYQLADITLPVEIETALAMAAREAVTNAQRHARASRVRVTLQGVDHRLHLLVEDDGRGGAIEPGNGLTGMRERLAGIGADLTIDSVRGRGTRLKVSLPLPQATTIDSKSTMTMLSSA